MLRYAVILANFLVFDLLFIAFLLRKISARLCSAAAAFKDAVIRIVAGVGVEMLTTGESAPSGFENTVFLCAARRLEKEVGAVGDLSTSLIPINLLVITLIFLALIGNF